jgi:hypothetical protein
MDRRPDSIFLNLKELKNQTDTTLHLVIDRVGLCIESGPKTDKMDWQVISVGDE